MSSQVAYRLGDGAPVTFDSARAIWTAVAREVLEETPSTRSISHPELARQVQQRSGVYTRSPAAEWLPAILAGVGDPDLTGRVRADAPPPAAASRGASTAPRRPRAEPAARKRTEAPPAICPTCFMQLPSSGRCDTCA
ncbi:MAG: hypothetical protein QOD07_2306 [Frankiaceae bacterium]|jgi:hypothetical protein|nr:hypothetical protein [Frankiaceae bacterium]